MMIGISLALTNAALLAGGGVPAIPYPASYGTDAIAVFDPASGVVLDSGISSWLAQTKQPEFSAFQAASARRPDLTANRAVFTLANADYLQTPSTEMQPVSKATLPDGAVSSVAGKGWTNTGLAKLADGTFWNGNAGSTDAVELSLVRHSNAFPPTILDEITYTELGLTFPSGQASVQGVCLDPDGSTLWFADPLKGGGRVYHIDPAGPSILATLNIANASGLAYDTVQNQLIVAPSGDNPTAAWYSRAGVATGQTRAITEIEVDHLFFTPGFLWISAGANGEAGRIIKIDLVTGTEVEAYRCTGAQAVEGFVIDGDDVYINSDGYRHASGSLLNEFIKVKKATVPAYGALGSKFVIAATIKLTSSPASATTILAIGDETTGVRLSTVASSTTGIRLFVGATFATWTGLTALTTEARYVFVVDPAANTATLYRNGVLVSTVAFNSAPVVTNVAAAPMTLGSGVLAGAVNRPFNGSLGKVAALKGTTAIVADFAALDAWLAAA